MTEPNVRTAAAACIISYLKNLVVGILGLLLYVGDDGSDGLDDGDDQRAEGSGAGVVEERRGDGAGHGAAADGRLVAAEVPRRH